jgi:hypothetical protein
VKHFQRKIDSLCKSWSRTGQSSGIVRSSRGEKSTLLQCKSYRAFSNDEFTGLIYMIPASSFLPVLQVEIVGTMGIRGMNLSTL